MKTSLRWTREQVKLAFYLYCQIPFGKIDSRNKEVISLANSIGRTPSAVAMKMLNIASLDPTITNSGRVGLGNASSLDKEIWGEFNSDWEGLAIESQLLRQNLEQNSADQKKPLALDSFTGEAKEVLTKQRIKQHFFRRAVISSYRGRCCMSGLSEAQLLIASHIVPWSQDKQNRLNPSNGLCLSAIHDKAFDRGLITLSDDFTVIVSKKILKRDDIFLQEIFLPLEGKAIELPERFSPNTAFIRWHRNELFVDNKT